MNKGLFHAYVYAYAYMSLQADGHMNVVCMKSTIESRIEHYCGSVILAFSTLQLPPPGPAPTPAPEAEPKKARQSRVPRNGTWVPSCAGRGSSVGVRV
jgi:hypothetical protein